MSKQEFAKAIAEQDASLWRLNKQKNNGQTIHAE
jgi:hypothetical protein